MCYPYSSFKKGVRFPHSSFKKGVRFLQSSFKKGVRSPHSSFKKGVRFPHSSFKKGVRIPHSSFKKGGLSIQFDCRDAAMNSRTVSNTKLKTRDDDTALSVVAKDGTVLTLKFSDMPSALLACVSCCGGCWCL